MNTAIVHIDCATDSIPEVAEALAALPGVSEVYSVAGNVDLIAIVRVPQFDDIAEVIAGSDLQDPGRGQHRVHIAFRAYSRARPRGRLRDRPAGRRLTTDTAERARLDGGPFLVHRRSASRR